MITQDPLAEGGPPGGAEPGAPRPKRRHVVTEAGLRERAEAERLGVTVEQLRAAALDRAREARAEGQSCRGAARAVGHNAPAETGPGLRGGRSRETVRVTLTSGPDWEAARRAALRVEAALEAEHRAEAERLARGRS